MKALVIGSAFYGMLSLPALLHRAGFGVHVLTTVRSVAWVKYIADLTVATDDEELITLASKKIECDFDLIVVADDVSLNLILKSKLPQDHKVKLLPVLCAENFDHINSKIVLSKLLQKAGINTPDFAVAYNADDLMTQARKIGLPLLVKIDYSGGGSGVYECVDMGEVNELLPNSLVFPVLVQRKIPGLVFDLSGFFQNGRLVHFSCSEELNFVAGPFSPSKVRRYYPLNQVDVRISEELERLGNALGAHGFINITCIVSSIDQKRYYIEADMRPNVWVEYPKFFNNDPAEAIRDYFACRQYYRYQGGNVTGFTDGIVLSYLPRMKTLEILLNKYHCWQFFDNYAGYPFLKWMIQNRLKLLGIQVIKLCMPPIVWSNLKQLRSWVCK